MERVGIRVWVWIRRCMTDWVVMSRYIMDLVGMTSLAGFHIGGEVLWYSCLSVETGDHVEGSTACLWRPCYTPRVGGHIRIGVH